MARDYLLNIDLSIFCFILRFWSFFIGLNFLQDSMSLNANFRHLIVLRLSTEMKRLTALGMLLT